MVPLRRKDIERVVSCWSADGGNHARAHQWEQKEKKTGRRGLERGLQRQKIQDEPFLLCFVFISVVFLLILSSGSYSHSMSLII